jgi:hypothetical protein
MSAFLYYEGTTDYLAATPALIVTFAASGSITAGRAVVFQSGSGGYVYQPTGQIAGAVNPAGVAISTVSDGDPVGVIVWGYCKSLPAANQTSIAGQALIVTGSGLWGNSGSVAPVSAAVVAGKIISGSAGYITAFINCMSNPQA